MKSKVYVLLALLFLLLASLACGSSDSDVVVNAPNEEEAPPQQEPTDLPEVGTSRSNPAPVGSEVTTDDMAFKILSVIRPADDIIEAGNMFNTEAESDQEYVLLELQITCKKSVDDQCIISSFWNVSLVGSSGIGYDPELFVTGVDGLLESIEFYGDATVSGYIPFIIKQSDTDLILVYEPLLFGDTVYLAVP
jgi:hypothetical protein